MANKNDQVLKRKVLFDNKEYQGLVETGELKDEEGIVEVPGFGRKASIKDNVKKLEPLELTYKIVKGTDTYSFLQKWYQENELHDVTILNTDGIGQEVSRWVLLDAECAKFSERTYNAGGVEWFGLQVSVITSQEPVITKSSL